MRWKGSPGGCCVQCLILGHTLQSRFEVSVYKSVSSVLDLYSLEQGYCKVQQEVDLERGLEVGSGGLVELLASSSRSLLPSLP